MQNSCSAELKLRSSYSGNKLPAIGLVSHKATCGSRAGKTGGPGSSFHIASMKKRTAQLNQNLAFNCEN